MESTQVIKKPLLTEKTTEAMNEYGRYAFLVDRRATKVDIKTAVERVYGVRVVGIQTQVRKGKTRRLRYGWVGQKPTKKAIVRLHDDDQIELF